MTLVMLFVLGTCIGSFLNVAIERLRWNQGVSSPWLPDPKRTTPAQWLDRMPVIGWWFWRRAEKRYGRGFWVRPLFLEVLTGCLSAGLYSWEVDQRQLLPAVWQFGPALPAGVWPVSLSLSLHLTYQSHLILLGLMLAATFIDIDDRIIPDSITIPGTLAGLFLAAFVPWSLLPADVFVVGAAPPVIDFLKLTSPGPWIAQFNGDPNQFSLWVGLGCYWGWCFALLPRHWRTRRGLKRACEILCARLVREPITWLVLLLAIAGSAAIWIAWRVGGPHWAGLITALVGMAAGGGVVWTVRVIGSVSLGKEAMGFGDVTLMAMIGAFLGWQTSVIVFFVAPLFALLIGVGNWLMRREHAIPYGPFLCLAALSCMLLWRDLWPWAAGRFFMPLLLMPWWFMPAAVAFCIVLMAVLLSGMRLLGGMFAGDERD